MQNIDILYPLSCDLVGHENQKIKFLCMEKNCQAQQRTLCIECQHEDKHKQHKMIEYQKFVIYAKKKRNEQEFDLEINALNKMIKEFKQAQELFIAKVQQYQAISIDDFENLTNTRKIIGQIFELEPYKLCQDLLKTITESYQRFSLEISKRKEKKIEDLMDIVPLKLEPPIKPPKPEIQILPQTQEQIIARMVEQLRQQAAQQYLILKYEDSLKTINVALKLDPNNLQCLKRKCDILEKFQQFDQALQICDFAIAKEDLAMWHHRKASIYGFQNNRQKRIEELREACRLNPNREKYQKELQQEEQGVLNFEQLGQRLLQVFIETDLISQKKEN